MITSSSGRSIIIIILHITLPDDVIGGGPRGGLPEGAVGPRGTIAVFIATVALVLLMLEGGKLGGGPRGYEIVVKL